MITIKDHSNQFAARAYPKKINETNPEANTTFLEAYLLARIGEKEKALSKFKGPIIYLALGMKANAIEALEKSQPKYRTLKNSPLFDEVRTEPRFQVVLEQARVIYEDKLKRCGN